MILIGQGHDVSRRLKQRVDVACVLRFVSVFPPVRVPSNYFSLQALSVAEASERPREGAGDRVSICVVGWFFALALLWTWVPSRVS